jgi:hypothetical protein
MNDNGLHYVCNKKPTRFSPMDWSSTTDSVIDLVLIAKELKHQIMFNIIDDDELTTGSDHKLLLWKVGLGEKNSDSIKRDKKMATG